MARSLSGSRRGTKAKYFVLGGGLDVTTPPLSIDPGRMLADVNFEPWYNGGYRRIPGYERFDGRKKPSDATYTGFDVTDILAMAPGDTLTQAATGQTGVVAAIEGDSVAITDVSGTWTHDQTADDITTDAGAETFTMAATPVAGTRVAPTTALDETFLLAAEDYYRDLIAVVPGEGEVRGVWQLGASVYAWRNDATDTFGDMYKASTSGWTKTGVTMTDYVRFDFGGNGTSVPMPADGTTVQDTTSGATAVIHRSIIQTGTMADDDAVGYLVLTSVVGTFGDDNTIEHPSGGGGTVFCTADGVNTTFAFSKDGHYQFHNHNFFASAATYFAYGCNGVDPAFEIDDSGVVSPILHAGGSATIPADQPASNAPILIEEHSNYLWLAFAGGSLQHSVLGEPLVWNGFLGAAEFGVGDEIAGLESMTGKVLAIITERESRGLFGTENDNFELKILAEKTGGKRYSVQGLDTVYGLDDLGITSLARTDAFGDFAGATVSQLVQTIVKSLRTLVTTSTVSRTSSQYRVYFSDKSILAMYVPSLGSAADRTYVGTRTKVEFGYLQYDIAVTRIWNTDDENGVERTYFASADGTAGLVYEDQIGRNFDGEVIESYIRLPFNHIGTPSRRKRFRRVDLEVAAGNLVTLQFLSDLSYGALEASTGSTSLLLTDVSQIDIIGGGGFWDDANWDEFLWDAQSIATARGDVTGTGENIGLLVYNTSAKAEPFVLQGVTLHYDERRLQR